MIRKKVILIILSLLTLCTTSCEREHAEWTAKEISDTYSVTRFYGSFSTSDKDQDGHDFGHDSICVVDLTIPKDLNDGDTITIYNIRLSARSSTLEAIKLKEIDHKNTNNNSVFYSRYDTGSTTFYRTGQNNWHIFNDIFSSNLQGSLTGVDKTLTFSVEIGNVSFSFTGEQVPMPGNIR